MTFDIRMDDLGEWRIPFVYFNSTVTDNEYQGSIHHHRHHHHVGPQGTKNVLPFFLLCQWNTPRILQIMWHGNQRPTVFWYSTDGRRSHPIGDSIVYRGQNGRCVCFMDWECVFKYTRLFTKPFFLFLETNMCKKYQSMWMEPGFSQKPKNVLIQKIWFKR